MKRSPRIAPSRRELRDLARSLFCDRLFLSLSRETVSRGNFLRNKRPPKPPKLSRSIPLSHAKILKENFLAALVPMGGKAMAALFRILIFHPPKPSYKYSSSMCSFSPFTIDPLYAASLPVDLPHRFSPDLLFVWLITWKHGSTGMLSKKVLMTMRTISTTITNGLFPNKVGRRP